MSPGLLIECLNNSNALLRAQALLKDLCGLDIILMDIMMPRMNGVEALDALKADPETKNIPVIMLSNIANEGDLFIFFQ